LFTKKLERRLDEKKTISLETITISTQPEARVHASKLLARWQAYMNFYLGIYSS